MRGLPLPHCPEFRPHAKQALNNLFIFLRVKGAGEIGQFLTRHKAGSKRVKQAKLQIRKLRKLLRSTPIPASDVRAAGQHAQAAARRIHKNRAGPAGQWRLSGISQAHARHRQAQATAEPGQMPQARKSAIGT